MKITILGSGGWGLANTILLNKNGHDITLWCFLESEARLLRETGGNEKLLPGVKLPENISITTDISWVKGADLIVVAVPSFGIASTAVNIKPFITPKQTVVLLSKGFDKENGYCLLADTLQRELPDNNIVVVTGPSHAEEVSRGIPTAVVAASKSRKAAEFVQNVYMNNEFRVYTSPDVVGAELGGAMKNIMALAVGISDGMGFGDNTKAMLMTRGIMEMARFGVAMGGKPETFSGLSGTGDLIVTCVSDHSRNRRMGLLLGKGKKPQEAIDEVGAVCEGFFAAEAVHHLAKDKDLDLPISDAMYKLLYEGEDLSRVASSLLSRQRKGEFSETWNKHLTWDE